jgi:uncharacterized membrane protein
MKLLRILAVGALVTWVISRFSRRIQKSQTHEQVNAKLDAALEDTFPASDPTATQDFAIPQNRL